ncbi:MAG TPA: hypothetical protein VGN88_01190 [Phycisphaerae bacterium]|jgi:hypothetical protein
MKIPILLLALLSLSAATFSADITTSEQSLGRIPRNRTPDFRLLANDDLSKAAAIDRWSQAGINKWYVVMDSLTWEFYDDIDPASAQFSSGGAHLSLLASHDKKWYLITDNKDARLLGADPCQSLTLSHDGKHDACIQFSPAGQRILLDGKAVSVQGAPGTFQAVTAPALSAQNGHLAFTARAGDQAYVILDDKILAKMPAEQILPALFSFDDKHITTAILSRDGTAANIIHITDGIPDQTYHAPPAQAQVANLTQSADGRHLAWTQQYQDDLLLVVDGKSRDPNAKSISQIILSPDASHVACLGQSRFDHLMLTIDTKFLEIFGESKASARFVNNGQTLQCIAGKTRYDFSLVGKEWQEQIVAVSSDNKLIIHAGAIIVANNKELSAEKFLDGTMTDSTTAYLLTETPTPVSVNDKTLSELTRTRIHLEEPPAPAATASPEK